MDNVGGWAMPIPIPVGVEPEAIMCHDGCLIINSAHQASVFENDKSRPMIVHGPALYPEAGDALNFGGYG